MSHALGRKLRKCRKIKGLSLDDLGRLCGMTGAHIGRLERGEQSNPRQETINALAKALDVAPSYLLYDVDTDPATKPEPIPEKIPAALKALQDWLDSLPDDEKTIVEGILKSLPTLKKPDISLIGQMVEPLKKLRAKKRKAGAGK